MPEKLTRTLGALARRRPRAGDAPRGGGRRGTGRPRTRRRAGLGDDHRDDRDRRDRAAGGVPRAGGHGGAERVRLGVRGRLTDRSTGTRPDATGGSSVAEFALVLVLLLMLFLGLVSVGLWAYARTILTSAAADAARAAATYGTAPEVATATRRPRSSVAGRRARHRGRSCPARFRRWRACW